MAIDKAGYLGIALYILGFGLSELLHLPAMVFVVAGVLCWGHFKGWLLALVMAPLSCALSFLVVRKIGGQVLADSQWSFVQKLMAKLDEYPVRTVLTLRLCFFLAPAINYVLALSSVSFRNFFIGTAAGLAGPLTVAVFFIDRLIEYMGWSKAQNAEIGQALHGPGQLPPFPHPRTQTQNTPTTSTTTTPSLVQAAQTPACRLHGKRRRRHRPQDARYQALASGRAWAWAVGWRIPGWTDATPSPTRTKAAKGWSGWIHCEALVAAART